MSTLYDANIRSTNKNMLSEKIYTEPTIQTDIREKERKHTKTVITLNTSLFIYSVCEVIVRNHQLKLMVPKNSFNNHKPSVRVYTPVLNFLSIFIANTLKTKTPLIKLKLLVFCRQIMLLLIENCKIAIAIT